MRSVIRFVGQGVVAFEIQGDPTILELAIDEWSIECGRELYGFPIYVAPGFRGDPHRVADSFMHWYARGTLNNCRAVGNPDMLVTVECVKNGVMVVTVQRREA